MAIDPLIFKGIIVAVTLVAAFLIIRLLDHFITKTGERFELEITLVQVLQEIVKYSIIVVAVVVVLNELGIDITALVLSLGILGIAVGFAARDTLSNFIAGLFVLGEKNFKVGDIIEVSDQIGTVIKMSFRTTTMVTTDNKVITIPNSLFSTETYINYTALDKRQVELPITIPYQWNLEDVIKSLEEKASNLNWILNEPEPQIVIREFSDLGIKASLKVWTDDPWNVLKNQSLLAREINELMVHQNA